MLVKAFIETDGQAWILSAMVGMLSCPCMASLLTHQRAFVAVLINWLWKKLGICRLLPIDTSVQVGVV